MSIRRDLIVMLGLAAMLVAAPAPASAKNRKGGDKDATQPFVVETRISAPKRIGEFELESSHYDPAAKHSGANFRYQLPDHPQIRFDLFVYPAGDMPPDTAMTTGMKNFVDSFDAGVQLKYYDDLEILDTIVFEIPPKPDAPAPDSEKSTTAAGEGEADARRSSKRRSPRNRSPANASTCVTPCACTTPAQTFEPGDTEIITIEYGPDDWTSK